MPVTLDRKNRPEDLNGQSIQTFRHRIKNYQTYIFLC